MYVHENKYWNFILIASSVAEKSKLNDLKSSFKKFKTTLSNKELNQQVIPLTDFPKNFASIIDQFKKDEATQFIVLELSLMLAHFLIENGMKNEALYFLTHSIYVSCSNISEVARVDINWLYIWKFKKN